MDGVVQSVALDGGAGRAGYWGAMLPDVRPTRALILGFGGGTLAHLLMERFGTLAIVGVDDDPRMLALSTALTGPHPPKLELVQADAFAFVSATAEHFDYLALDLFRGGEIPRGLLSRPFLRDLRRILSPNGLLVVNLFRDRLAASRIERLTPVFRIRLQRPIGNNLIVFCE